MGLGRIAPHQRGLFRWHGWALGLWLGVVGAASTALLYRAGVHALSTRYALSALAIYGLGFLLGGWVYARWWAARVPHAVVDAATPIEETAYSDAVQERTKPIRWLEGWNCSGLGDDWLSALFAVISLLLLALVARWFLGLMPWVLTDWLAGFLAEVVLECVAGAVVVRRMAHRYGGHADYWPHMLVKTIWVGLCFVLAAWVVGWCLHAISPEAQTLGQVVSQWFHYVSERPSPAL